MHIENSKLEHQLSPSNRERWLEIATFITKAVDQRLMSIPRAYFSSPTSSYQLHVFGDASKHAYGAVAYLVNNNQVAFVMPKSKINPKKNESREGEKELSIPEAELMASYIGTLLAETIFFAFEPLGMRPFIFLWSDSQIVHFWISKTDGHPWPFITNRV